MGQVLANGITLEVARFGDPSLEPVVLIRGLGTQLIQWPDALITALVAGGFHVVVFDNRDVGLSQKCDGMSYDLSDMAADTVGLMEALGLGRAHVVGLSMGGMILQIMALTNPERVISGVVVMSSSLEPSLPKPVPEVEAALQEPAPSAALADVIAHELRLGRLWQSPAWPFDEQTRMAEITECWRRCHCPQGVARQHRAMMSSAAELAGIEAINVPMLVIHGRDDALFSVDHGRDIAARISGAELLEIAGMGHDLEGPLPRIIADHMLRFFRCESVRRPG